MAKRAEALAAMHQWVLVVFAQLLLCIADDPLVGSIAQQYLADREAHDKTAAEWVKRYAQG